MDTIFPQTYFNLHRPAVTILTDMINLNNTGAMFMEDDFLWGTPEVNTRTDIACNTELLLMGNPDKNYTGTETIWYNRVDLGGVFDGSDVTILVYEGAERLSAVIDEINSKFGLYLTPDDYEDVSLPAVAQTTACVVRLVAKPTSLMFVGSAYVKLGNWSVDPAEVAVSSTGVFLVNYTEAAATGQWMRRANASMVPNDTWMPTLSQYYLLPSVIKDHAILGDSGQIFVGTLNYKQVNAVDPVLIATITTTAVAIVHGAVIDLHAMLARKTALAAMIDFEIYSCTRGSDQGEVIIGIYCPNSPFKHYNVLVDAYGEFEILGVIPCATAQNNVDNRSTLYTDLIPLHYLEAPADDAPTYVNVVISSMAVFLRFLNRDLSLNVLFSPIAVDCINQSNLIFFSSILPQHFSFTGRSENGATKLLLNMKFDATLYDRHDIATRYTALLLRFNGTCVTPDSTQVNGYAYDKAWLGCVEITTEGAQLPTKFFSDVMSYRSMMIDAAQAEKSQAGLIYSLAGNTGYAGIRMAINSVYDQPDESAYPIKFSNEGLVELRGMNQFVADQVMTTIQDAIAEEVFYLDNVGGVHSRGVIWHLLGFAANTRNDFVNDKPKALTYMVFDTNRNMVLCRQSNLDTISFGSGETKGSFTYTAQKSFAWLVRK